MAPQVLTAKPIAGYAEPGKESYEIIWIIPNWEDVQKSKDLVWSQQAMFETGASSAWFRTKWFVGLHTWLQIDGNVLFGAYWKLLAILGPQSDKLEVELESHMWNFLKDMPFDPDKLNGDVREFDRVSFSSGFNIPTVYPGFTNSSGSMKYVLKLALKTPTMDDLELERYKMEQFSKRCAEQVLRNQAALLNDHSETADLKFITSDGVEIRAHKSILQAQCPVFAGMFNCDLSEKATGVIRMTDITGKTMKILLRFFYTGELDPSWRDPAYIVELTYSAGKYQMTQVLEQLDDMLGRDCYSGAEVGNLDVQLINLAGKLRLEKAEERLLERIVAKVKKLGTVGEFFELFGYDQDEISELAATLSDEKVGEAFLGMMCFLGGCPKPSTLKKGKNLLALVMVRREEFKMFGNLLLRRLATSVEFVKNADELFDLCGCGKQMEE